MLATVVVVTAVVSTRAASVHDAALFVTIALTIIPAAMLQDRYKADTSVHVAR
ncbi:MAG TPA: hypothetical protein VKV57_16335 [bacterium]|nr:hypothetical protein [bacterium]